MGAGGERRVGGVSVPVSVQGGSLAKEGRVRLEAKRARLVAGTGQGEEVGAPEPGPPIISKSSTPALGGH